MDAELIAIGTELLRSFRPDGNSEWLTRELQRLGRDVRQRTLVEDDTDRIAAAVTASLGRTDVVLLTGGLGPTEDDRTREALARALDTPLERDPEMERELAGRYQERGYPFGPAQARQADRPRGMRWLPNPVGSAAGLLLVRSGKLLAALPGVPAEMQAIFRGPLRDELRGRSSGTLAVRTLRIAGRTESSVDEAVADLYATPGTSTTILGGPYGVTLELRAREGSAAAAARRLDGLERRIRERLGSDVFGRDDETLAGVVGALLRRCARSVSTAESCTAGLLAAALTEVPGSSAWFRGGLVTYADPLKVRLAGVPERTLASHGAVSAEVAAALARGARRVCGSDVGVGITGIAGPGGGSREKPVGLVFGALEDDDGQEGWRLDLPGDRELIRRRAVTGALDRLRRRLEGSAKRGAGA